MRMKTTYVPIVGEVFPFNKRLGEDFRKKLIFKYKLSKIHEMLFEFDTGCVYVFHFGLSNIRR